MADREHPKTHVEDQDVDLPRKQPESPKHEGIDPLTESDTMYPRTNTKTDSEKLARKEETSAADTESEDKTAETVEDQNEVNAKANTPNDLLPETDKGNDNAAVEGDLKDEEAGVTNTSPSNKTTDDNAAEDVKAAEKKVSTSTPKSKASESKTSSR